MAEERERARKRIRTFCDPDLDADNDTVVDAYITVHRTLGRVHAKRLKEVLGTKRTQVDKGAKHKHIFYTVPHSNFPEGISGSLPKKYKDKVKSPEQLQKYQTSDGCEVNFPDHWVVDRSCPLNLLGDDVGEVEFFSLIKRSITIAPPGPQAMCDAPAPEPTGGSQKGGAAEEAPVAPAQQSAGAAEGAPGVAPAPQPQPEAAPAPEEKAAAGTEEAAPAPEGGAAPTPQKQRGREETLGSETSAKKRRLEIRISLESDETEGGKEEQAKLTLEGLVDGCKKAAANDAFWSADPVMVVHTVYFFAKAGADGAKPREGAGGPTAEQQILMKYFPTFLTDLLMDHACFDSLKYFDAVYKDFRSMGATVPSAADIICGVMHYDTNKDSAFEFSGASSKARRKFRDSKLMVEITQRRVQSLLVKLRSQTADEEVVQRTLKDLRVCQGLPEDMAKSINFCINMLSPSLPLEQRMASVGGFIFYRA